MSSLTVLLSANNTRCPDINNPPGPGVQQLPHTSWTDSFQGSTPQQLLSHNVADRGPKSRNSSKHVMQNHAFANDPLIISSSVMESRMMNTSRAAQPQLSSDTTSLLLRRQRCRGYSPAGCGMAVMPENIAQPLPASQTLQSADCATTPESDESWSIQALMAAGPEQDESAIIDVLLEYGLQVAMAEAVAELAAVPPWSAAVHAAKPPDNFPAVAAAASASKLVGPCSGKAERHMAAAAAGPLCRALPFHHYTAASSGQVTSTRAGDDEGAGQIIIQRVQLAANCSAGDATPPASGTPLLDRHQVTKNKDKASKLKLLPVTSSIGLTSKYRGVCWNKRNRRWQASINHAGRYIYLGSYIDEVDAARQFDLAAVHMRGPKKAKLNFPVTDYSQKPLDIECRTAARSPDQQWW